MSTAGEVLVFIGRMVMSSLAFILENIIIGIGYAHNTFPQATTTVFVLIGAYLAYRFVKKVIRLWINFLISTVKTILTLVLVGVVFAIYLRGFHRFFTKDIYFIADMLKTTAAEDFDYRRSGFEYASKVVDGKYEFLRRGAQTLFGEEDVTIGQLQDLRDGAEEFIAENIDGVKDFLKTNGLNIDFNAHNIHDFLNNFRF